MSTVVLQARVVKVRDASTVTEESRAEMKGNKLSENSLVTNPWHSVFPFYCPLASSKVSPKHLIRVFLLPRGESYCLWLLRLVFKHVSSPSLIWSKSNRGQWEALKEESGCPGMGVSSQWQSPRPLSTGISGFYFIKQDDVLSWVGAPEWMKGGSGILWPTVNTGPITNWGIEAVLF